MSSNQVHQKRNGHSNSHSFSTFSRRFTGVDLQIQAPKSDEIRTLSRNDVLAEICELRALKAASQVLLSLAESLRKPASPGLLRHKFETPATPRVGIATLPYEILLEIFEFIFDSEGEYAIIEANVLICLLSSVCRRFREVILAFPKIWAYINLSWLEEEVVERHLTRSKGMPLYIQFDFKDCMARTLRLALEHKDRWLYLRCYLGRGHWRVLDPHPSLVFPSLRMLRVYIEQEISRLRRDDLFSGWTFPSLDDLELRDAIPKSDVFDHKSLTRFKYISEFPSYCADLVFLTSLTGFLGSATSLRTVELDVSQITFGWVDEPPKSILLPSLTHLTVTNLNRYWTNRREYADHDPMRWQDYIGILRVLLIPAVQKISMSVIIEYDARFDLHDMIYLPFCPSGDLEFLTDFEFTLRWWDMEREWKGPVDIPIYQFFWTFPLLEDLTLDAEGCTYSFENKHSLQLEEMRSLCIKNWDSNGKLYDMLCDMKQWGVEPREIQIHSKKRVGSSMENLRSVFPEARIEVIQPDSE